ncbi:transglycosylase domain-containing protein [Haloplasma contractile]|uniref:Penicillin-binding protein 1A-1B n=1 Tax=Haloplasma contractile SSD-17B TaxID=1033810 RepID=U2EG43_9MOLU|nr:PBP1A family penicillin-binding protein [Haloplasma contractile]ERJ13586.1 Penicillin-binding protein 1A-1B [Haloplasma contractile SSD-17B]
MSKRVIRSVSRILLKIAMLSGVLLLIGSIFLGSVVYKMVQDTPKLDIDKIYSKTPSKIYDVNGNILLELGVEKRDIIKYDDISSNMVNALLAVEDARFFKHEGIDTKRILGAIVANIKELGYAEGASTITQQLVKNSYLSNEKTIERKIKEMVLSHRLEKELSKEQILEAYLNKILFGGKIYGVERASKYYFGKSADELEIAEAALLAGMIQKPNLYNPYNNPKGTKSRQETVINQMLENAFISAKEAEDAINIPIDDLVIPHEPNNEYDKYNQYLDYVIQEMKRKYNIDPVTEEVEIYTHLNTELQDYVIDLEQNKFKNFPNDSLETGIVVLENNTGFIRAIGGGRNHNGSLTFNYATQARRQPGSTIKPILDFGPAIEYLNYSTGHPFYDEKIYYSAGNGYMPISNWDDQYKGYVTMRQALIESRNVPAVKAFLDVGSSKAAEFARNLGLQVKSNLSEAQAIGGFKYGFTVLEMAAAFSAFGNKGVHVEPTTIDYYMKDGDIHKPERKSRIAMREETAYLMSDMLHENMIVGTANRANVDRLMIAGKTGQTNYSEYISEEYDFPYGAVRDAWFIGYTSKYTTSVWVGYDKIIDKTSYLNKEDTKIPLDIFRQVMDQTHKEIPEPFMKPESIIEVEIETHTSPIALPNEYTPSKYIEKELFIKGYEPKLESNRFRPLDRPRNFMVNYNYDTGSIDFNWDQLENDFSYDELELMEKINELKSKYDFYKRKVTRDHKKQSDYIPKFLDESSWQTLINQYCDENTSDSTDHDTINDTESQKSSFTVNDRYCTDLTGQSLNFYIKLLDELKRYEEYRLLEDKQLKILSEAQISEIRGYRTWNGYRDGLYSTLGNIKYRIIGKKGLKEEILYEGPYKDQVAVEMNMIKYFSYDHFYIEADYSKYTHKLKSDPNISINPFVSFEFF